MAYPTYNGAAYPQNYYNGYNNGIPDQGNRFTGQYQQGVNFPLQTAAQMPMPQSSNGVIWVQGEEGAKAYMVAPGNTVQLWDSENPVIYLKSADMSGVPSTRIFDLVERRAAARIPSNVQNSEFITRAEFSALEERINALTKEQAKPVKSSKSKEDMENG